jgi:outer membrane protein assembly factor BamB
MRYFLMLAAALAVVGCSREKDVEPPAELVEFDATRRIERVWSASVGGDAEIQRLGLALGANSTHVFGAGRGGDVAAFAIESGRQAWRTETRASLSGGTGADDSVVAVGSIDGEVIALDAKTGAERWRARVSGEVLSAPAVSENIVAVRTVDGGLRGLSATDGREVWLHEQQVPRLSLRGTSRPVITGDLVICGFDNGKVVAVNLADGALVWETPVTPPRGRTELERLVDIDSAVVVSGNDVFTAGFQGRVAMLARDTGQIWWSREASSYRGVGVDDNAVYLSSADGEVVALRRTTGVELWRQNVLARRGLSAPAAHENGVVVGDFQGYVHVLDKASGALGARVGSLDARLSQPPLVIGGLALVITDRGRLAAFRIRDLAGRSEPAPEPASEPIPEPVPEPATEAAPAETEPPPPETSAETPPGG